MQYPRSLRSVTKKLLLHLDGLIVGGVSQLDLGGTLQYWKSSAPRATIHAAARERMSAQLETPFIAVPSKTYKFSCSAADPPLIYCGQKLIASHAYFSSNLMSWT